MTRRAPILIVDDHPVFLQGLTAVMRSRGFEDVHAFNGSEPIDAMTRLAAEGPWAAILDVRLGERDGVALCRALRATRNPPVVIMLSTFSEPAIVQAARDAGAYAYLSKEADASTIVELMHAGLADGGTVIPQRSLPTLSARERAVLIRLAAGMTNKRMAQELDIGVETVKDHLQRLFDKLDVRDRLNAVKRARELGMLDR